MLLGLVNLSAVPQIKNWRGWICVAISLRLSKIDDNPGMLSSGKIFQHFF